MTSTDTGVVPIATTLFAHNFPSITITITIITGAHGIAPLTQLLLTVATKRHPRGTIASFLEFNVRVSKARPRHTFFRLLLNDSETKKFILVRPEAEAGPRSSECSANQAKTDCTRRPLSELVLCLKKVCR